MKGTHVLMAGFGGQGVLLAAKILAQAGMDSGLEVSWLPSYGPEMRGGTANAVVCLSPEPIASPLVSRPRALVAMNRPSLEKFAPLVQAGGLIVVNRSLVEVPAGRDDCRVVSVDTRALAQQAGNERAANLVALGAYVGASGVLEPAAIEQAIATELGPDKARFVPASVAAFRAGLAAGREARAPVEVTP